MAIAFVAAGTRLKADVSLTGSPQSVGLPAGHVSGHLLLLYVVTDDNNGPDTPSGWIKLTEITPGLSASSPYAGYPRTNLFYQVDDGTLGSTVSVAFNTGAWPTGKPYVLAYTAAWSGCDPLNPIGEWNFSTSTATTDAQAHPQLTTALVNSVLLTLRSVGADSAKTFVISGGTNTERVDDSHGSPAAPSLALYDTAALSAGLQTQRTTTASAPVQYGSTMISLVLRPATVASGAVALAGCATVSATANGPTASVVVGPWDLCGAGGLPDYRFGIDWDQDGSLDESGTILSDNPYFRTGISGFSASNSVLGWETSLFTHKAMKITPNGASASGGANAVPRTAVGSVVAGQSYIADVWAYSPAGWSDLRACIDWHDAADAYLSTGGLAGTTAVPAGQWTRLRQTIVAPASSSRASIRARHAGTPAASDVWYVYGLRLINPSTGETLLAFGPGEDVTGDELDTVTVSYGRDQDRQLSPGSVGTASARLCNVERTYSPEFSASPLFGDLDPARDARFEVNWAGVEFPLFRGRIDDYDVKADFSDRTVSFSFLDGLALLQGHRMSTGVYESMRTGELISTILDDAGWTAPRDIDNGATIVQYWWAEGTDALTAVQDLIKSEGPPSVAYVAPDGTFVFRDRHHRLLRPQSATSQAAFGAAVAFGCASPAVSGFDISQPFTYSHGWRDIVNSVTFEISERSKSSELSEVWTSDSSYSLVIGQSVEIDITTSDPFVDAVTPVSGTDFIASGLGTPGVVLSRTSGASAKITILAVGGNLVISNLQLRARLIPVARTINVQRMDTGSITEHGERTYPESAPWANANDAGAIADMILLHYSKRRPTVQLRVQTQNPAHFLQVLQRTISDRIHIRNDELGLDDDFFVERVTHTIQRINQTGKAPVHSVVLGCEKQLALSSNPFTFDKRGAGFDDGVFDPISADDADTVFIFDDPTQGQFDVGLFGT